MLMVVVELVMVKLFLTTLLLILSAGADSPTLYCTIRPSRRTWWWWRWW